MSSITIRNKLVAKTFSSKFAVLCDFEPRLGDKIEDVYIIINDFLEDLDGVEGISEYRPQASFALADIATPKRGDRILRQSDGKRFDLVIRDTGDRFVETWAIVCSEKL